MARGPAASLGQPLAWSTCAPGPSRRPPQEQQHEGHARWHGPPPHLAQASARPKGWRAMQRQSTGARGAGVVGAVTSGERGGGGVRSGVRSGARIECCCGGCRCGGGDGAVGAPRLRCGGGPTVLGFLKAPRFDEGPAAAAGRAVVAASGVVASGVVASGVVARGVVAAAAAAALGLCACGWCCSCAAGWSSETSRSLMKALRFCCAAAESARALPPAVEKPMSAPRAGTFHSVFLSILEVIFYFL